MRPILVPLSLACTLGIIPYAHYICREMLGYAIFPDGKRRTLIHIPDWNLNWQKESVPCAHPAARKATRRYGIYVR